MSVHDYNDICGLLPGAQQAQSGYYPHAAGIGHTTSWDMDWVAANSHSAHMYDT